MVLVRMIRVSILLVEHPPQRQRRSRARHAGGNGKIPITSTLPDHAWRSCPACNPPEPIPEPVYTAEQMKGIRERLEIAREAAVKAAVKAERERCMAWLFNYNIHNGLPWSALNKGIRDGDPA